MIISSCLYVFREEAIGTHRYMCILIESNLGAGAGELLHRSLRYYKRGSTGGLDCISLLPVSFSTHGDHVNIILL